jgi:hypothetical protein
VIACNPAGCGASSGDSVHIAPPPPSATVGDGGYVGYKQNSLNTSDPAYYYWHKLSLCVNNFTPGTYNIWFANDSQGHYGDTTISLPANGCRDTGSQGGTTTQGGSNSDWFSITVVGVLTTPHYRPW